MPTISYKNSTLHYLRFGEGLELLFALHGFADQSSLWKNLEPILGEQYTCIALDLPFHGDTLWQESAFLPEDMEAIIRLFLKKENKQSFAMIGHSMGTRLILKILPRFPQQVSRLFLLAPDGIRNKWMFNMNLTPHWIRNWAQKRMEQPAHFLKRAERLHRMGLLNRLGFRFLQVHLENERRRKRLFGTWIFLRHFITYPPSLKSYLKKNLIPTHLIFGKRDTIIPVWIGEKFQKNIPTIQLTIINQGHRMSGKELENALEEILKK